MTEHSSLIKSGRVWLLSSFAISLLAHIELLYSCGLFERLDFVLPVTLTSVVTIDLKQLPQIPKERVAGRGTPNLNNPDSQPVTKTMPFTSESISDQEETPIPEKHQSYRPDVNQVEKQNKENKSVTFELLPPLRLSDEFMGTVSEKFQYRISLLGIPVGNAELRAWKNKTDLWITLRVTSDAVMSTFYPVDDFIETRHINGNFIITKIRQKEGSFISDRGFTIFLRDKYVFWLDRLTRKSAQESIPNSRVVDLLSGLYYLRNCKLEEGKTETVQLYDSDSYASVPVEVLHRETVRLPALREFSSFLIQPQLKTDGIFKRTGAMQIWLSDDEFRVPIKFSTTIPIGKITAELVSAETGEQLPQK